MKSEEVLRALRNRYSDPRHWIFVTEARLGTGSDYGWEWSNDRNKSGRFYKVKKTTVNQSIDAFAMSCFAGEHYHKIAFEVKVSRSDFLREIREPVKRAGALNISNHFYFITPPDLVNVSEIPDECGLMEVYPYQLRVAKKAPLRKCAEPSWSFIASMLRNVAASAVEQWQAERKKIESSRANTTALPIQT